MIEYDFTGKTVVVTGGGRGIGKRIAQRFAASGANVAVCRHSADGLEALEREIAHCSGDDQTVVRSCDVAAHDGIAPKTPRPARVRAYAVDVASTAAVQSFFDAVVKDFGDIDVLVNDAGVYSKEPIADVTSDEWNRVMNTNVRGLFFACQSFAKHHHNTGTPGVIVNISSVSAVSFFPDNLLYNVSKSAVVTITKTLARALGPEGIRVNAVGPGSIPTDLNAELYKDKSKERELCDKLPLRRRGTKDDVANCVMFLASDEADYVTGQVLFADGGWTTL